MSLNIGYFRYLMCSKDGGFASPLAKTGALRVPYFDEMKIQCMKFIQHEGLKREVPLIQDGVTVVVSQ